MATSEDLMTTLRREASDCYLWSNGPGDRYAPHSHGYEKVLYCVEGSITSYSKARAIASNWRQGTEWCCRPAQFTAPRSERTDALASRAGASRMLAA